MSCVNCFPGDLCLNHEKEHLQCKLHCWRSIYRQLNHFYFLDALVICSYCFVWGGERWGEMSIYKYGQSRWQRLSLM